MRIARGPLALILSTISLIALNAGGVSEEVHTSFKAGEGFVVDGEVRFLVSYHLYRAPEGLRRFPDGGQSKTLLHRSYVVAVRGDNPVMLEALPGEALATRELASKSAELFLSHGAPAEAFDMNVTNRLLREYGLGAAGFPSPLEYCEKRRKAYLDDIVNLRGDLQYRKEIIRVLDIQGDEAAALIERMQAREEKLEGSKRMEYALYSEDTRAELRENL